MDLTRFHSVPPFALFRALVLPFPHPCLDELDFLLLCIGYRLRWEFGGCLIGEESILVPVVNSVVNHDKRLIESALSSPSTPFVGVRCGRTPWIPFTVEECETSVGDVISSVLVDALYIWRGRNVEAVPADLRKKSAKCPSQYVGL